MRHYAAPALAAFASLGGPSSFGQVAVTRPAVSEEACPIEGSSRPRRTDGHEATAVVRKPPGNGPFPGI